MGTLEVVGGAGKDGDANKLAIWGRSRWSLAGDADLWSAIWGALKVIVTAAIKPSAEAACRLCRGGAVKTEGQLSIYFFAPPHKAISDCVPIKGEARPHKAVADCAPKTQRKVKKALYPYLPLLAFTGPYWPLSNCATLSNLLFCNWIRTVAAEER